MAVLIVDDEASLRMCLSAYLDDFNYAAQEAENGLQALDMLIKDKDSIQAVIVDLNMPVMDGYEFIEKASAFNPHLPIIALSGVGVVDQAIQAIRLGAWDFIPKPLENMNIVTHILEKALERAKLIDENNRYQTQLEQMVHFRTKQLGAARRQIMQRLSRAAEYKDNETGHHVIRVGEMAALLGRALSFDEECCELLKECAPLHDVGKIGIPDVVLLKPGKLNNDEWQIMQKHCEFGYDILGPLLNSNNNSYDRSNNFETSDDDNVYLQLARILALNHHEHWGGTGYPKRLKKNDIPIEARIVTLVDVFDALRSHRPYKPAFSHERSLKIIQEGNGTLFDPDVVKAFDENLNAIEKIYEQWGDNSLEDTPQS